uniref:Uncharacterized protein n=1 Tax=Brassica oleracea var. oleracea TaxID=109376 RepID=A0A0D3BVA3_BRAOL
MHESEASHNVDSKHLRPLICTEEAVGFHKRVKRIHDHVKIVVPCAVVVVEFPIPPNRSMQLSPYNGLHAKASQRGLRFRDEVDKGPEEATSVDTDRIPSNDTNKPASIDITTSPSIDTGRISEQKEFDVKPAVLFMLRSEVGRGECQTGFAKLLARGDDSKF